MVSSPRARQVLHDLQTQALGTRNSALLLGPGGEVEAAHAAGDADPAIPEPIIGRVPEVDPGGNAQATAMATIAATVVASPQVVRIFFVAVLAVYLRN